MTQLRLSKELLGGNYMDDFEVLCSAERLRDVRAYQRKEGNKVVCSIFRAQQGYGDVTTSININDLTSPTDYSTKI